LDSIVYVKSYDQLNECEIDELNDLSSYSEEMIENRFYSINDTN